MFPQTNPWVKTEMEMAIISSKNENSFIKPKIKPVTANIDKTALNINLEILGFISSMKRYL